MKNTQNPHEECTEKLCRNCKNLCTCIFGDDPPPHNYTDFCDGFVQATQPCKDLNEVIDSLHTTMTTDSRDWGAGERDAWVYGIVVGWGDALYEVGSMFGWSNKNVDRLQKYNDYVCRCLSAKDAKKYTVETVLELEK